MGAVENLRRLYRRGDQDVPDDDIYIAIKTICLVLWMDYWRSILTVGIFDRWFLWGGSFSKIFSILFLISGTELNCKERGTWGDKGTKGDYISIYPSPTSTSIMPTGHDAFRRRREETRQIGIWHGQEPKTRRTPNHGIFTAEHTPPRQSLRHG